VGNYSEIEISSMELENVELRKRLPLNNLQSHSPCIIKVSDCLAVAVFNQNFSKCTAVVQTSVNI
jgi:hypothetical protein